MKVYLKPLLIVGPILLIVGFAFNYFLSPKNVSMPSSVEQLKNMETLGMPDFSAKNWDMKDFSLKEQSSKIVILNFWASWCAPCVEEIPSLVKLIDHYKGQVQLVAVSGDSEKKDIEVFLKSFPGLLGKDINLVWDNSHKIMDLYGVQKLPESFISAGGMKLTKKIVGTINWYTPDSIAYIDSLLKKDTLVKPEEKSEDKHK